MSTPIITLDVAGKELKFAPTMVAYNGFINDMMPNDKVAPAHNYLKKIVCAESKEALDDLLKRPSAALQLAGAINKEFAPELEITVKTDGARRGHRAQPTGAGAGAAALLPAP